MSEGKVLGIRRSIKKGAPNEALDQAIFIQGFGLDGDLHGGKAGRQVTFMGIETIQVIKKSEIKGFCTNKFVENITTGEIDLWRLPAGRCLKIGEALMVITKVGKECFRGCPVREQEGTCIMLKQVVFADVIKGGLVKTGDSIIVMDVAKAKDSNKGGEDEI